MAATIPSPQLQAITRLEFASDALTKALRAVQHPELDLAGGAIVAPSGLKHLAEIRTTLSAIERTIRPCDPIAYESAVVRYDRQRARLPEASVAAFRAADEALAHFERAQDLLAEMPDEAPEGRDDDEIVALACECRTAEGDRRVERMTRGFWRTLAGVCSKCRGQIHEI
jgi:hypothetical protein